MANLSENAKQRKKDGMMLGHTLVITSKKTGKVKKMLTTQCGKAQLVLYALQNVKKSEDATIYETESEQITDMIKGTNDFPELEKDIYDQELFVEIEE